MIRSMQHGRNVEFGSCPTMSNMWPNGPRIWRVMTIVCFNFQSKDKNAQVFLWHHFNHVMAPHRIPKPHFKGFMADNVQTNWNTANEWIQCHLNGGMLRYVVYMWLCYVLVLFASGGWHSSCRDTQSLFTRQLPQYASSVAAPYPWGFIQLDLEVQISDIEREALK